MSERQDGSERVVLVHVDFSASKMIEDLQEFGELARAAGAEVVATVTAARSAPDAKTFVGSGKADEIKAVVDLHRADLVLFNHVLSAGQERNLERLLKCRVLDRTGLILDIFARRARSFEGKLQVELAVLKHHSTRLIRGWTHLERQRGGIGLRGPGETQLEVDRRLLRDKIKLIGLRLAKIRKQREQGRKSRQKATIPTVALVGYTNAGKSTLFNQLTGADVFVADQLFATLDPTLRRVELAEVGAVILADTVGFIRHLPHDLVIAFHATLEEVATADLLLHVVDASDEQKDVHIEQVNEVLETIGAKDVPRLLVYNKIDLLSNMSPKVGRDEYGVAKRVYISAAKRLGLLELASALKEILSKDIVDKQLLLTPNEAKLRAMLYEKDVVLDEKIDDEGNMHLHVRMPRVLYDKLFH